MVPERVKESEVQNVLESLRTVHLMTPELSEVPATVAAGHLSYGKAI